MIWLMSFSNSIRETNATKPLITQMSSSGISAALGPGNWPLTGLPAVRRAMYTHATSLECQLKNRAGGAYHGAELWHTFNNIPYSDYSNVAWYDYDYVVEDKMSNYWANFIRKGDPNGDGLPKFIRTTNQTKETMWLDNLWVAGPISDAKLSQRVSFPERWFATLKEW